MAWSSLKRAGTLNEENPTACWVPELRMVCGVGITKPPLASFALSSASATGLMFEPSHRTWLLGNVGAPPWNVREYENPGLPAGLLSGQNAAPSAARERSLVSVAGKVTPEVAAGATPFTWRVPWYDRK